jgi:hypothetical protein
VQRWELDLVGWWGNEALSSGFLRLLVDTGEVRCVEVDFSSEGV